MPTRFRFTALALSALAVGAVLSRSTIGADGTGHKSILVVAHRGAHKTVPENTLASLEKAIELGVDYVELDVRRTKDGVLVLLHDASVNRMTNGKGKIEDLTFDEIHKLNIRGGRRPPDKRSPLSTNFSSTRRVG